ncbi:hypothetical protein GGR57DRAFT_482746 [Xylariaceae sp. FL1272]|nr:hypothetical protein GGR57DRAFT_482746 [Xylariaceae sp. FL1272]
MEQQEGIISEKGSRIPRRPVHRPAQDGSPAGPSETTHGQEAESSHQQSFEPPPYSGPTTSAAAPAVSSSRQQNPKGPQYYPGLPLLDYRQYTPPMFDLSADGTTITSKATYLSENVKALSGLIQTLAAVPPKPQVLIHGARGRHVDFSLKLNLMSLLVPDNPRNRMDYLRCVAKDEMAYRGSNEPSLRPDLPPGDDGLEAWCARFTKDQSSVKTFTLERVVANLDTNWLEGQIRSLIASLSYKGSVTVSFPVTHARVTVQNPDKVNKFFTSVTTLFTGKAKYEVVKAVWPFANAKNGESGRKCIVQSENTWWQEWRDPIKYAIAQKRQGWVTNEDKLESLMERKGDGAMIDWGPEPSMYG